MALLLLFLALPASAATVDYGQDPNSINQTYNTSTGSYSNIRVLGTSISGTISATQVAAGSLNASVVASSIAVNTVYPAGAAAGTYSNIVLPAANVNSGSLGGSVIASSIAVNTLYPAAVSANTYSNITLPAANVANGSLGSSVLSSSITLAAMYGSPTLSTPTLVGLAGTTGSDINVTAKNGTSAPGRSVILTAGSGDGIGNSAGNITLQGGTCTSGCTGTFLYINNASGVVIRDTTGSTTYGIISSAGLQFLDATVSTSANIPAANVTGGSLGSKVIASSITLAAMYGAPTLTGTNFTSLPGAQVGSGVPAANIAAGTLGGSVLSSSVAVNSVIWNQAIASFPSACSAGNYVTAVGATLSCSVPVGTGGDVLRASTQTFTGLDTFVSSVAIYGNAPITPPAYTNAPLVVAASTNNYMQAVVQNLSNGANASGNIIVTSNLGGDTSFYAELGINSSLYSNASYSITQGTWAYLMSSDAGLAIGAGVRGTDSTSRLLFFTSAPTSGNLRMSFESNGAMTVPSTATFSSQVGMTGAGLQASKASITTLMGQQGSLGINISSTTTQSSSATYTSSVTIAGIWVSLKQPTIQVFTSGSSATYTTPTAPVPRYIRVRMVGGGGGGAGSGTGAGTAAGAGGGTFFAVQAAPPSLLIANGGGVGGFNTANSGAGGTASIGPTSGFARSGGTGQGPTSVSAGVNAAPGGGNGAASPFGGAGGGGAATQAGQAAIANTGSGGGGAGGSNAQAGGGGGSAGGFVESVITSPGATYIYTVGANGTAGGAGTSGAAGAAGASGFIIVEEYY